MLHPEAELHQAPEAPDVDSYYGRDEFVRGLIRWSREFEEPRFEPLEVTSVGVCVIVRVGLSGTGRASGIPVSREFFHAWALRDGKPQRCVVRSTWAEAVRAVGVGE
jgi:hypothetical protein